MTGELYAVSSLQKGDHGDSGSGECWRVSERSPGLSSDSLEFLVPWERTREMADVGLFT